MCAGDNNIYRLKGVLNAHAYAWADQRGRVLQNQELTMSHPGSQLKLVGRAPRQPYLTLCTQTQNTLSLMTHKH